MTKTVCYNYDTYLCNLQMVFENKDCWLMNIRKIVNDTLGLIILCSLFSRFSSFFSETDWPITLKLCTAVAQPPGQMKSIFSKRCGQMGTGQQRSKGVRNFQIRFTGLKFVLVVDEPRRNCLPLFLLLWSNGYRSAEVKRWPEISNLLYGFQIRTIGRRASEKLFAPFF